MGTMQSTLERIAAEESPKPDDGWTPGTDVLDPDGNPPSGEQPASTAESDVSRETSLPTVGHVVVYHLREGDSRNRRVKFPALVMDSDPELGLRLWVVVDDGDTWTQERVPERRGPEAGWEYVDSAPVYLPPGIFSDVLAQIDALRAEKDHLAERLAAVESHPALEIPSLNPPKRGPGRPKKG